MGLQWGLDGIDKIKYCYYKEINLISFLKKIKKFRNFLVKERGNKGFQGFGQ